MNDEAQAALGRLDDVVGSTWSVLLDFDGPVTHYFVNGRNKRLADQLRRVLDQHNVAVPEGVTDTYDPLTVLRWAALHTSTEIAGEVDAASVEGEYQCADEAEPTPGAADLLTACREAGRPVVIVSNNADGPIRTFLTRYRLDHLVDAVIGRTPNRPDLMKPNSHLVDQALKLLEQPASSCVLVGDSVSDVQVAIATHVRSIGYAKTPKRGNELVAAGADALITNVGDLATAVMNRTAHPTKPAV